MEDKRSKFRKYPYSYIIEEGEKWIQCDCCPFKSRGVRNMRSHMKHRHLKSADINWHKCEECSYKGKTTYMLKQHVFGKHTEDVEWLTCEKCPRFRTIRQRALWRHNRDVHGTSEEINWIECAHCAYKAKRGDHMRGHHARKHNSEEKKCELCDETPKQKVYANIVIVERVPKSLPRERTPLRSSPRKSAPEESVAGKSAPKKSVTKKSAPRKSIAKKKAPQKSVTKKTSPQKRTLRKKK